MTDFETILRILVKANYQSFEVNVIKGEYPSIDVPSPHPENYTTGVTFTFNDDGSLYSVHSYEPDL